MRFIHRSVWSACTGMALASGFAVASPANALTRAEKANEQVVLGYYAEMNAADATHTTAEKAQAIIEKYFAPDYFQHGDRLAAVPGNTSREKMIYFHQHQPAPPGAMPAPKTVQIMAEGDRVMLLTSREGPGGKENFIFNMFRLKDGKLAEHWNVVSPPGSPPPGGTPAPGAPPHGW